MNTMSKKLGEEPAFPSEYSGGGKDELGMPIIVHRKCYGISKRLYLAGMAMQGLLSNTEHNRVAFDDIIKRSLECADELLKQSEL